MPPVNLGFTNIVPVDCVAAPVGPEPAPFRRMVRDRGDVVGLSSGRPTRAVLVLHSGHAAFAPEPETNAGRIAQNREAARDDSEE